MGTAGEMLDTGFSCQSAIALVTVGHQKAPPLVHKSFKGDVPGFAHMDIKYLSQMADQTSRSYLFVAIDRVTRWVFAKSKKDKSAASARSLMDALHKTCRSKITRLLTDTGKEFTDRPFAPRKRKSSGNHEFDVLCQDIGIEHRLTPLRSLQSNGMVARFNGRIGDLLQTHRFNCALDMNKTLPRYVGLYNHQLPHFSLQNKTPIQTMKQWYESHPELFNKRPYNLPGRAR